MYITSMARPNHIHSCQKKKKKKETDSFGGSFHNFPKIKETGSRALAQVIYIDRLLKIGSRAYSMAFTMRMSARRCPIGFGGMGHGAQNDEEDEPVEPPPAGNGVLVLTKHCEYPSIPNGAAHDGFAVMVQVKAPTLVGRTPLDLVAVLDVSGSMAGPS